MRLVVDMNVLFSFFKSGTKTRELISSFELLKLYTPSLCIKELIKHREEICSKSKISESQFFSLLEDLKLFVKVVDEVKFKDFAPKAAKLLFPHLKDTPYLALALWFKEYGFDIGIWSNERRFKSIKHGIKVYSTTELLKKFELI